MPEESPPIDRLAPYNARGYQFTRDWFLSRVPVWESIIKPRLLGSDAQNPRAINGIEIGSYEGLSATWILENLFANPASRLHCVDIWRNAEVQARFNANMNNTGRGVQVIPHKEPAVDAVRRSLVIGERFNFAYIDGDHTAKAVMQDASLLWPQMRKGGIMVFDDYGWTPPQGVLPPSQGIDAFLDAFAGEYNLLHKQWQVIIRKSV